MPRTKYNVVSAMYDVRPVDDTGYVDVEKISDIEPLLNLGRKLRIGKSGQPALRSSIKNKVSSIKYKKPEPVIKESEILNTEYIIRNTVEDPEDFEKYLNEDINPATELVAMGGEVVRQSNFRPRYRPIFSPKKSAMTKFQFSISNQIPSPNDQIPNEEVPEKESFEDILLQINQKVPPADECDMVGEPKRTDITNWWEEARSEKRKTQSVAIKSETNPKFPKFKIKIPRYKLQTANYKKLFAGGFAVVTIFLFTEYGFSLKNEIVHNGNSAVANLESAGENIKNLDFNAASTNFAQAYSDFSEAGDDLNFMGSAMTSLIGDLPGGGKIKAAKKLVEAGKLMADAGQAMSQAIEELAKINLILLPTSDVVTTSDVKTGSNASIGSISQNMRQALVLSQKNIKEAGELLEDVDAGSLPEDKRASFEEFNSKLPEFGKMITDAVDYSKFLEDFIGTAGTKKYLLLFQNPAELRPTGGFPGSYGIVVFKDGKLQDFRVDDVYNLDGQLKELYVPPLQLQHITPTWAMRDANWFVDFPVSARKMSEFYKKESGEDVDGVITFSPQIVSKILKITGPIRMDKYGVTLNSENFSRAIQEEVEYKADRNQPKKILVDLAPLMLEKIYSADSDRWMEIFNILVSSVDGKDILMYFRDLKLQDFSVTKGFSGQVNQTGGDYLMVTLTNVKGSKTDTVTDSELKVDTIFEGDDVRHRLVLTRTHNGGGTKFGFFNKQSPAYVRMLVPEDAQLLGIYGNSRPNFMPLMDYPKTDFKRDEDLVRFEEKSNYDSETGVTIYEEAGKREYGFWMILNPGETKAIELEYGVPGKAAGKEHEFYMQRQPGLEFKKFTLNFISGAEEIGQSSVELKKGDGRYTFTGKLDRDLPVKIIFK